MSGICIAIDGPAAAGKSTVAKIVANRLGYIYLDTGAMYRTLTYAALKAGIELSNETQLKMLMPKINITFSPDKTNGGQRVFLNGEDVSDAIRSESVTSNVSEVAMVLAVREEMKARQSSCLRQLTNEQSVVLMKIKPKVINMYHWTF